MRSLHLTSFYSFLTIPSSFFTRASPLSNGPWGPDNPVADPNAIISLKNPSVRFTVLTERLIRIEQGRYDDRKTLAVINRNLTVPEFSTDIKNGVLTIATESLRLEYVVGRPFSNETLSITGKLTEETTWTWKYGDKGDDGNLLGTIRTLDRSNIVSLKCSDQPAEKHCAPGLISRNGYAIVDDSMNWALNGEDDWWDSINRNQVDLYVFGHGHDYKAAIADYMKIGGKIPLLPRYALGVWFSRWYDYNPTSARVVVETFEQLSLPLDVFVFDMNWHKKNDWGGYSWDSHIYNPSQDAVAYMKHRNLAVTLNLHDANGVNDWDTQFEAMCKAMGCNGTKIPFSILNKTYLLALEDLVLKPLEDGNGIDFWWIDWQQGEGRDAPTHKIGIDGGKQNPTILTAHVRSTDRNRRQEAKRSMVLARWGGLGAHRYPVHFAGDAQISWSQLSFQPYFSMTATNVGAIWSHDISGQKSDPELFTRWLQWSVVSGVSRVHDKGSSAGTCAMLDHETCTTVEAWDAPSKYAMVNYEALRLRGALIPYLYTCAYKAHKETGLWFIRPLYYDWPELDGAYITASPHPDSSAIYESQFMFGDDLLAAPVVSPANTTTGLAAMDLWIPPGTWVGFSGGRVLRSAREGLPICIHADINDIPLFAKAGSVIPTIPVESGSSIGLAMKPYQHLVWTVYLASKGTQLTGSGYVYEDDGATTNYLSGHTAFITASYTIDKDQTKLYFTVHNSGSHDVMPSTRSTTVRLVNAVPPSKVIAMNKTIPFSRFGGSGTWSYDALKTAVIVEIPPVKVLTTISIEVDTLTSARLDGLGFKISNALKAKDALDEIRLTPGAKAKHVDSSSSLLQAASLSSSLEYFASDQEAFLDKVDLFHNLMKEAIIEVWNLFCQYNDTDISALRSRRVLGKDNKKTVNHILRAYALLKEAE